MNLLTAVINLLENRHRELSWILLEAKVRYYIFDSPTMDDYQYDMLEKQYERLCKILHKENTISDMVGCNTSRPSVRLISDKIQKNMDRMDIYAYKNELWC